MNSKFTHEKTKKYVKSSFTADAKSFMNVQSARTLAISSSHKFPLGKSNEVSLKPHNFLKKHQDNKSPRSMV